jgi:hypothetical protein
MSDTAHAEPRAAALESSGPSDAMKPSASKTCRGWRPDVRRSHRAAGMESPNARKTWGGGRADVDSCGPTNPMKTAAPSKPWGDRRANVGNSDAPAMEISGPAKPVKTAAASKAWRDRRADVGNAGAVKLMKVAAANAAVEAATGKSRGAGRGSGAEIRRGVAAAGAKATKTWTMEGLKGRSTASSQTDRRRGAGSA